MTDSNRRRLMPADLQSAPVGHLGNRPCGSNDLATECRIGFAETVAHADLTAPFTRKPTTGVEPVAYRLQGGCSAIELRRHDNKTRPTCPAPFHYTRIEFSPADFARRVYQDSTGSSMNSNVRRIPGIYRSFFAPRREVNIYIAIDAATEAFNDSIRPAIGILTTKSHDSRTNRRNPRPSDPTTNPRASSN